MITEREAIERGLNQFQIAWGIMEGEIEAEVALTPMEKIHGRFVERRCEAYHDINVYEDGYEEYIYIGD